MTVRDRDSRVRCSEGGGASFDLQKCQLALNRMPVLKQRQMFGGAGDPGVAVRLPNVFVDGKLVHLFGF